MKNKLGFVDGSCLKGTYKGDLTAQWERCNVVVLSWISSTVAQELLTTIVYASNAKRVWDDFKERFDKSNLTRVYQLWVEVSSLKQGTDSVTAYYSKLRDLWDEFDVLVPAPLCNCAEAKPYFEHLSQQRLLMFLMGLNESYSHVRSDILLKVVVPTVNQVYATVIQEESQRSLGVMDLHKEPLTMMVNRRQTFKGKKLWNTTCEHCGYKNHLSKDCYRIVGYPNNFKSRRKQGDTYGGNPGYRGQGDTGSTHRFNNQNSSFRSYANYASNAGHRDELTLTEEEYNHVQNLMHNTTSTDVGDGSECKANLAGNVFLTPTDYECSWIIDLGATHHITSSKDLLAELSCPSDQRKNTVQLPTGKKAHITNTGNSIVLGSYKMQDVLHVPVFKFNLLSVARLTKDLSCSVSFFPNFLCDAVTLKWQGDWDW